jgi:ribosome-associated translation inhibitor RaiA
MQITTKTSGSGFPVDLDAFLDKKFAQLDRLASDATLECSLEQSIAVERSGAKYKAEGNLLVDGEVYHASAEGPTLESAVDRVRNDLARSLKRSRGKAHGLMKRGGNTLKNLLRFGR